MLVCVSVSGAVHQGVMTVIMMCMRVNAGLCQHQWCCASGCDDSDDDHCLRAPRNILEATPSCSV